VTFSRFFLFSCLRGIAPCGGIIEFQIREMIGLSDLLVFTAADPTGDQKGPEDDIFAKFEWLCGACRATAEFTHTNAKEKHISTKSECYPSHLSHCCLCLLFPVPLPAPVPVPGRLWLPHGESLQRAHSCGLTSNERQDRGGKGEERSGGRVAPHYHAAEGLKDALEDAHNASKERKRPSYSVF
jgi:hypothetical protein